MGRQKDSGGKFVRHHGVTRQDVLVHNVSVFQRLNPLEDDEQETVKLLYVSTSSLRKLADVSVSQPTLPDDTDDEVRHLALTWFPPSPSPLPSRLAPPPCPPDLPLDKAASHT